MDWLVYIFYGFISGLGQILPVSVGAHDYFLELMTNFSTQQPLLQLSAHLASLLALGLFFRHRIAHIYREMRLASLPPRSRKRQPDMVAVLDGRVLLTMLIPAAIGLLLTRSVTGRTASLPLVSLMLLLSGVMLYFPHFLQSGNRDSRHLSRLEAAGFGVCAGFSALPGVSRTGMVLSAGAIRGCERRYVLDLSMLLMVPLLALMVLMDLFALGAVRASLSLLQMLFGLLAAVASFGGTCLAIASLRFLAVNRGYTAFSYYNWGLAVFGFILYLVI